MKNIMLDLETLGTHSNAVIIAIGAVEFDPDLGVTDKFYINVDPQSCIDKGLTVDGSTVTWWLKQSDEARQGVVKNQKPLKDALTQFRDWLGKDNNLQLWGNGADFDNAILKNAFTAYRVPEPWPFWANRCFRTFKSSFLKIDLPRSGVHHNAVDDAAWQAEYLIKLVEKHKLKNVL